MTDIRWIADNELSDKWPFWTRANVGEVLPGPPSPLGWELVWESGTLKGWYDAAVNRMGYHDVGLDPERPEMAGLLGGFAYLNATGIRLFGTRTPGMTTEAIDMAYFGDHPDVPPYVAEDWHESAEGTAVLEGWLGWVMGSMQQDELEGDRVAGHQARASRPDLQAISDADLMSRARSFEPLIRRMFDQHINQSAAASVGPGVLGAVCAALGQPAATMRLFTGLGDVDSAAPSYAMWEMSRAVRSSQALNTLFDHGVAGLDQRINTSSDPAAVSLAASLTDFLVDFGSRGPNEWDIHAHTWETNPDLVWAAVDRMRLAEDSASPITENKSRETEREDLSAELVGALAADRTVRCRRGCGRRCRRRLESRNYREPRARNPLCSVSHRRHPQDPRRRHDRGQRRDRCRHDPLTARPAGVRQTALPRRRRTRTHGSTAMSSAHRRDRRGHASRLVMGWPNS